MGFIVKVAGAGLGMTWLAPSPAGSYAFGPRHNAIVFKTQEAAWAAADNAAKSFGSLGMIFTVESAD
jgi:hypothetical protein